MVRGLFDGNAYINLGLSAIIRVRDQLFEIKDEDLIYIGKLDELSRSGGMILRGSSTSESGRPFDEFYTFIVSDAVSIEVAR